MKAVFRLIEDDESPVLIGICSNKDSALEIIKKSFEENKYGEDHILTSNSDFTRFSLKTIEIDEDENSLGIWACWEVVSVELDSYLNIKPCSFANDFTYLLNLEILHEG